MRRKPRPETSRARTCDATLLTYLFFLLSVFISLIPMLSFPSPSLQPSSSRPYPSTFFSSSSPSSFLPDSLPSCYSHQVASSSLLRAFYTFSLQPILSYLSVMFVFRYSFVFKSAALVRLVEVHASIVCNVRHIGPRDVDGRSYEQLPSSCNFVPVGFLLSLLRTLNGVNKEAPARGQTRRKTRIGEVRKEEGQGK